MEPNSNKEVILKFKTFSKSEDVETWKEALLIHLGKTEDWRQFLPGGINAVWQEGGDNDWDDDTKSAFQNLISCITSLCPVHIGIAIELQCTSVYWIMDFILQKFHLQFDALYTTEELIGEGGFGSVHKARSRENPEEVFAVKTFKDKMSRYSLDIMKTSLQREIDFLRRCRHENIVGLHDFFVEHHQIQIVMEFCDLGDLKKVIELQRKTKEFFSDEFIFACIKDVVRAVSYLHKINIIHCDIKPQNILICKGTSQEEQLSITVKLADFGNSRLTGIKIFIIHKVIIRCTSRPNMSVILFQLICYAIYYTQSCY